LIFKAFCRRKPYFSKCPKVGVENYRDRFFGLRSDAARGGENADA